jgi:hypothetical protein
MYRSDPLPYPYKGTYIKPDFIIETCCQFHTVTCSTVGDLAYDIAGPKIRTCLRDHLSGQIVSEGSDMLGTVYCVFSPNLLTFSFPEDDHTIIAS